MGRRDEDHPLLPELAANDGAGIEASVTGLPLIFTRRDLDVVPRWPSRNETIHVAPAAFLRVYNGLGPGIVIHHGPFDRENTLIVVSHDQDKGVHRHLKRDAAV